MVINLAIGGGTNLAKNKISAGNVTNNLDAIDATDAKNVVKNVDVTDAKNVIKNADITDAKNVIKDIDAADVKNAVRDVDAIDVSDGKYSLMGEMTDADGKAYEKFLKEGPQEGLTQAEVIGIYKADKQTALNIKSKRVVSGKGIECGKVWDYSKQFEGELVNFNVGYEIKKVVDKDLYLVQFHCNADVGSGRSLKYWTTFDEVNKISTIDDYMDKMALMSNWGARDNVSIAKVPAGTKIKYAIGTAKEQVGVIELRTGGGLQILFEQFDDSWLLDTRPLS